MKIIYCMTALLLGTASLAAFAGEPCCAEQDFRGVGISPEGVKIQLTEVKRTSPNDIRVTWTLKNTTQNPQPLTKGDGASWSDKYKLSLGANLLDTAARVRIKVAKDSQGHILAAVHSPQRKGVIALGAGKTITTWANFIAPAGTTAVTVDLPGATMPWDNIAVSN